MASSLHLQLTITLATEKPCKLSLSTSSVGGGGLGATMSPSAPATPTYMYPSSGGTIFGLRSPKTPLATAPTSPGALIVLLAARPTPSATSSVPITPTDSPRTPVTPTPTANDSELDDAHPAPLPARGVLQKFRKRLLSVDGKLGALASAATGGGSGSNPNSPRSSMDSPRRPLFVDTQLANTNGDASKKRSPVTTMVDFMRGRNRTNSLQLSSSPLVSPQTIAARTSASVDGQAMFSPGRRPPLSRLYQRSSFGGTSGGNGGMKSFDSGLDLTSPTINHTALLIKEVRGPFFSFLDRKSSKYSNRKQSDWEKESNLFNIWK
ncbi:unnamed protein product [Caenorhabditis auriculariae]|uniref:Uncharacterized protein n=1 Tax=Caenorhabditis auriculariae TaxID=2777116 RepID=A0A8S1HH61_9PELO|nr:unnamed protein product [Caenorhabditis auriculariae]